MPATKALLKKSDFLFCGAANARLPHLAAVPLEAFGDECECKVKEGDFVEEGAVLAAAKSGRLLRSPVPGKIERICSRLLPSGRTLKCAEIKTEGEFSFLAKKREKSDWRSLSMRETRARIASCGVENLFDFSKPSSSLGEEISNFPHTAAKNVVVRLFDLDPSCAVDSFIAESHFEKVFTGAQIVANASAAQNLVFACKKKKAEFFAQKIGGAEGVRLVELEKNVDFGGKREILAALGEKNGAEFSDEDLAVDCAALLDVYNAVVFETPVTEHFVMISGDAVAKPMILKARLGTSVESLLRECGGLKFAPRLIAANGIFKGVALRDIKAPISQDTKSVVFSRRRVWAASPESPCSRCGNCHYVCPESLFPDAILSCRDESSAIFKSASLCRECGACNSACPSRIPILQKILAAKKRIEK